LALGVYLCGQQTGKAAQGYAYKKRLRTHHQSAEDIP
jgi:hypothetical protein